MRIINVIILKAGIIEKIESFPILEENDPIDTQNQIKQAENLFEQWCIKNGWENGYYENEEILPSMEELIEQGYYENSNYDSIFLTWSNVNL